jgi:hypothetical protein
MHAPVGHDAVYALAHGYQGKQQLLRGFCFPVSALCASRCSHAFRRHTCATAVDRLLLPLQIKDEFALSSEEEEDE